MPQWITDLFAGWPMIRANLPSFVFIVILIFAAVWWLMDWRYGGIITNRDSEISLLKGQRDDYKDKLSGATPDQAKAKIEGLERAVHMAIGAKWEPLTKAENRDPGPQTEIDSEKSHSDHIRECIRQRAGAKLSGCREAGWDAASLVTGTGFGDEVLIGWSTRAVAAKEAIESSSNIKVRAFDTEKEIADLMVLGVGINSH